MRIEWSAFALADRGAIFDYIEADNPKAAISVDETIRAQIATLAKFPESGRPGRVRETRELVISGTAYIAAYRVEGNIVRILRILHGAQRWPDEIQESSE